ncbi:peptide/nickel transport system permease protein [Lampropedia hyalina DSM 16112]|jgi:peptide/nickel transport system permease protein|uniref:Peptide/nickel transport system permease protein n=1 Tax=Lampropedia hyalina DSM 16112 TaxID=1122156 RepID=A0A1M4SIC3_9BURK|nr:ABC transporter permease [Lampropedia hyalina]SHE31950.1 peptide/nickel transport system permease protein [Lampropedia hyalina DSM 16112]
MTTAPLLRFLRHRLLYVLPVVLGIAMLNFLILQLAPGDVVDVLAGEAGAATPETMAQLRAQFGLDQPVHVQFLHYMGNVLTLDLGYSHRQNMPVLELILQRMPATLLLMLAAILIALALGVVLGVLSALKVHGWVDTLISIVLLVSYAIPTFWLGLMAIVLFSAKLGWLPSGGMVDLRAAHTGLAWGWDVARHLVLPALTLSTFYLAVYAKLVRSAMLELHGADFIRTARAKGLGELRVTLHHALRNALLPLVTMLGYQVASLLSGAVLVESVFNWPGLGRLAFEAVNARDLNLLMGILLMSSILVTVINIVVDLVYSWLDPRVQASA